MNYVLIIGIHFVNSKLIKQLYVLIIFMSKENFGNIVFTIIIIYF